MAVYFWIGIGGVVGSLLRYGVSILTLELLNRGFPYGTLIVNLIGSFLLGWFTTNILQKNKISRHFSLAIGTGLIGSFTTFSTLSNEVLTLIQNGLITEMVIYILVSLIGGLFLAFIGLSLGNHKEGKPI
ncbi:fluoride efflux transporter CrcB [Cytobacillus sp. FJAT-54145]|uniref:Fluoride-specific ion channel FluC n=1 Tax=Cytobacillus spartinae TaxID=3299023 RepID=A0ABW6K5P5_9BACI